MYGIRRGGRIIFIEFGREVVGHGIRKLLGATWSYLAGGTGNAAGAT